MFKIFNRLVIIVSVILLVFIAYFSLIGFETKKFNEEIKSNLKKIDPNIGIELKDVKIILNIPNFEVKIKTLGSVIDYKKKKINLESITTSISVIDLLKKDYTSSSFNISTKPIKLKESISLLKTITKDPKFLILEHMIDGGVLIVDFKFGLNQKGKLVNDYEINGLVKDGDLNLLNNKKIKNIEFSFEIKNKFSNIKDLNFSYNKINFDSKKISIKNNNNLISIEGQIHNNLLSLSENDISDLVQINQNFSLNNLEFSSNNDFLIELDKKYKIKNFKLLSLIDLKNLSAMHEYQLKDYLPNSTNKIQLKDHKIDLKFTKNNISIKGNGELKAQNDFEKIEYTVKKKENNYFFESYLDFKKSSIILNFLNFKKKDKSELALSLKGKYNKNKGLEISSINLKDNLNVFLIKNLEFNKNLKFSSIQSADFKFIDKNDKENVFSLKKNKDKYQLIGRKFNATKLIDDLLFKDNQNKNEYFDKNLNLIINLDEVLIHDGYTISNLIGNLEFDDSSVVNGKITSEFSSKDKLLLTINTKGEKKITTFFSDKAKPFVKKFKFIKGFDEGSLDFYSVKTGNTSNSKIKIYDFKLKELPLLTKILTLASLQGIVDILSGEGIRFNEFEMNFENKKNLMNINEVYAIGPSISVLMDGYIEKQKITSLRGTLVPATTLNKVVGSIPLLGEILVGKKTGEGVFGVSFKIKGPPQKLETTVNPIKTLTPRFITRTLEKIKKN